MEGRTIFNHILRILTVLIVLTSVIFYTVKPAFAADIRSGETVIVADGEDIDDDLYLVGNNLLIDDNVHGDLLAIGGTITVDSCVDNSVLAIGGKVSINNEICTRLE